MDRKMKVLGDEALTAVSGGTLRRRRKLPPGWYGVKKESSATATGGTNTVGDIDVRGGHNTVIIEQDASAEANSSVS